MAADLAFAAPAGLPASTARLCGNTVLERARISAPEQPFADSLSPGKIRRGSEVEPAAITIDGQSHWAAHHHIDGNSIGDLAADGRLFQSRLAHWHYLECDGRITDGGADARRAGGDRRCSFERGAGRVRH